MVAAMDYSGASPEIAARLVDVLIDDDEMAITTLIAMTGNPDMVLEEAAEPRLPRFLRNACRAVHIAAFLGAISSFRALIALGADVHWLDSAQRSIAHFACCGGSFAICRELDGMGVDWLSPSRGGHVRRIWREDNEGILLRRGGVDLVSFPADCAAMFGRLGILRWLWAKGYLSEAERVG